MDPGGKIECLNGKPPQASQCEHQGAEARVLQGSYLVPLSL